MGNPAPTIQKHRVGHVLQVLSHRFTGDIPYPFPGVALVRSADLRFFGWFAGGLDRQGLACVGGSDGLGVWMWVWGEEGGRGPG